MSPKELDESLANNSLMPFLIDVREEEELKIAPFTFKVCHLPLSQITIWKDNLSNIIPIDRPVVVICHSGFRSMQFGNWILQNGLIQEVWNLDGGIDAWSLEIDNSVPRY